MSIFSKLPFYVCLEIFKDFMSLKDFEILILLSAIKLREYYFWKCAQTRPIFVLDSNAKISRIQNINTQLSWIASRRLQFVELNLFAGTDCFESHSFKYTVNSSKVRILKLDNLYEEHKSSVDGLVDLINSCPRLTSLTTLYDPHLEDECLMGKIKSEILHQLVHCNTSSFCRFSLFHFASNCTKLVTFLGFVKP